MPPSGELAFLCAPFGGAYVQPRWIFDESLLFPLSLDVAMFLSTAILIAGIIRMFEGVHDTLFRYADNKVYFRMIRFDI